ncbi:hypothetical protein D3C75_786760 [compost metagenome]
MRNDPTLQTIIQAIAVLVIAITRRHFTVSPSVISIRGTRITDVIGAIPFLHVPVEGIVFHCDTVKTHRMRSAGFLAGIHGVVSPCARQESVKRNADIQCNLLVFVVAGGLAVSV